MPAWQRTAALFINFPQMAADGVERWDLTALCACVQNCGAFEAAERAVAMSVRKVRNTAEHKNVCVPDDAFHGLMDRLGDALCDLGVPPEEAKQRLRPYRDGMERCMPARTSLAEALQYDTDQRAGLVKLLTERQKARFDELRRAERPCRRLLEAPAGSGKTLIAVKLIAAHLRAQQEAGVAAPLPALLLVHTRALQMHVLDELRAELGEEGSTAELREGLVRLELPHGVAAFVATVDGLCGEMAGRKAQTREEVAAALTAYDGRVPRGGIGLAIVDEGHHARSSESNPRHASPPLSPPSRSDRGCYVRRSSAGRTTQRLRARRGSPIRRASSR
jgi:hypothetical protein